jgi:hypothetical protein
MLLRLLQLLSVFLIIMMTGGPASAGTINVLGSVDIGPGLIPTGVLNLGGDRGFTLNGFAEFFTLGPSNQCIGVSSECSPGTTIFLHANSTGSDVTATGTLDGVSIPQIGGNCPGRGPCGSPSFVFTGQTVAPAFGDFTKAIVKAPVDFSGSLIVDIPGGVSLVETLVASATATLTLDKVNSTNPQFPGPAWQYAGIEYELEPIPEPTTLLLLSTTLAGLALARRRWRGQN